MDVTLGNYKTLDFEAINIQEEWNVSAEKENLMHGIHKYPAKFPAFITTKAIHKAETQGTDVNTVADIFCGCGTVALETVREGKHFWGCDINPVATLIARTKSKVYDNDLLKRYHDKISSIYRDSKVNGKDGIYNNERISYWFDKKHIDDLLKLRTAIIYYVDDEKYKDFFLCAFSNILKPCSRWLSKSIKPQIAPNKHCKDVFQAYESQITMMLKANLSNTQETLGHADIERANFLECEFGGPFVDLLVTSPPYVTSYEYADLHQLSSLWLGYVDDFKTLRKGSIGSLYHAGKYEENFTKLNDTGKDVVSKVYITDKKKAHSVAQYYVDMQVAIQKVNQILNFGGACLFVIGNTEYKGVKIDNAKHLTECLLKEGFNGIEVDRRKISNKILTPYRDEQGKFTRASNGSRKIYSEEFVIFARK